MAIGFLKNVTSKLSIELASCLYNQVIYRGVISNDEIAVIRYSVSAVIPPQTVTIRH